ncbi:hypothetical protein DFH09DRAFT_1275873 [Mycena vulgaris]|nr:hypothetical protein DFH09DRAFT_1275873 [Mycena vulgaris]
METLAAATTVIAVVTAARDIIELIMRVRKALKQVKRNRQDHADQIQQILDLLSEIATACDGIKSERPGLLEAVNKLRLSLDHCMEVCDAMEIPRGFKGFLKKGSIKQALEDVNTSVKDFLRHFSMGSQIRIERTTSDNSDKLDKLEKLLSLERNTSSPTYTRSLNSGNQSPTGSSRKTREFLIGRLQKLSKWVASSPPLSQRVSSPVYPDGLVSNTHRPRLSDATKGLLDAIAKTELMLETYGTDPAGDSAHSLDNLSVALMDVGLAAQAAEISSFSVKIYGSIEASEPDSNFAIALHNHSHHLSAAHRINEAMEQAQRAVDIYARLRNRVFLGPGRAKALDNLAACLFAVNKTEEALAASDKAVQISSDLLGRKPDDERLSADLAMFLSNRAHRCHALGYIANALNDAYKSQEMYGTLYQSNHLSDWYTAEYADSLCVYSQLLSDRREALVPARKAVELWRELDAVNSEVHSPKLARGLLNVADVLSDLGRLLEAEEEIRTAVDIFRRLAAQSPDEFNPEYARSLHRTARILMDRQSYEKALRFLNEALSAHNGKQDIDFAVAVYDAKYMCLNRLKRLAEAAEASRSAISILERAPRSANSQRRLTASRRDLASTMYNLSVQSGRSPDTALGPALEAVKLFRVLLAETPDDTDTREKLVEATRSLSMFYSDLGNHEEALKYASYSVRKGIENGLRLGDGLILKKAWTRLSFCCREIGDEEGAEEAENQASRL